MTQPIYTQIAEELRNNIQQQTYQPGDKLPTEAQLSQRFGVHRHTIRSAIAILKEEGLIRVDRGRGTFVAATPIQYPIGKRVRYNENLKAQGIKASYQTIKAVEIPADKAIATSLKIEIGAKVIFIERLGLADNQPISIASSYFSGDRFPDLISHWKKHTSISQLLKEVYSCEHLRYSTKISARIVRETDARLLQVPLNYPILLAESINVDGDDKIIEYGVSRFCGEKMELVFINET
ncbi:MAG: phosphonate metabolism transcriptional regulator PhnF [Xenococcaceae cyanobacterium]